MISSKMYSHKRIKNSPMRSPSPDYANHNRTGRTSLPLYELITFKNQLQNPSPSKFPQIPIDLIRRKTISQIENIQPTTSKNQFSLHLSTGIKKPQKQSLSIPISQVSPFDTAIEDLQTKISINEIQKIISQIHTILFKNKLKQSINKNISNQNQDEEEFFTAMYSKLNQVKSQLMQLFDSQKILQSQKKDQKLFNSFGGEEYEQFGYKYKSNQYKMIMPMFSDGNKFICNDSPIKKGSHNEQDSFVSLFKHNELQNENTKLKKQILKLKFQLQNRIKQIPDSMNVVKSQNKLKTNDQLMNGQGINNRKQDRLEQDSSMSSAICLFLKQKIMYLQKQLQNKINKVFVIENQKNDQINHLRQKLQSIEELLNVETKNYKSMVDTLRAKIQELKLEKQCKNVNRSPANTNQNKQQEPRRQRLNSESIKGTKQNQRSNQASKLKRLSLKNALSWDKQEIISLYDKQHLPQQSLYSQAERVDIENLFSARKQLSVRIQKIKQHYQQIIIQNMMNYNQNLSKLKNELVQLKKYIKTYEIQEHEDYLNCDKCESFIQIIKHKNIKISYLQKQSNMLRVQVEEEKILNRKLRDLLHNVYTNQFHKNKLKTNKKRRGIQRKLKSSLKSLQSGQNSQQLVPSQNAEYLQRHNNRQQKQQPEENQGISYNQADSVLLT